MDPRNGSRRTRTLLVVAALVIQLVIIGSVIAEPLLTTVSGRTVRLAVGPVDPRDPLRGDYLAVSYEISTLDESSDLQLKQGQTVWMPLKKDGPVWVAVEPVMTAQPSTQQLGALGATAVIKGKVASADRGTIDYGIDRYFVPEGTGLTFPSGAVIAEVKLSADGTAVLRRIYVDGRVWP